jgi:precorrin-6A synthase
VRTVYVIGIGSGDPDHLTLQAVAALKRVDVVFVIDKGEVKEDLTALRTGILDRHLEPGSYRVVEAADPERDRGAGAGEAGRSERYTAAVVDWQDRRGSLYASMLAELADGETGAFLVWGDPSLYDGTLRLLEGVEGIEVVSYPGISSVQALAAAHKIPINRIGESVLITTGRKLADGFPDHADSVVVMLDGQCAFNTVDPDTKIYWGAYLGTDDEILVSGRLGDVAQEIERVRREARDRKGWIMDTYLLRKPRKD